ncbi:MAG: hypothetical protein ACYTFI_13755 [Planctomycetota bacterium]|jgi:hypothetical protein
MKMLLRHMMIPELIKLLEKHEGLSSAPHLVDAASKKRARQTAKKNGVWESIGEELDPTRDIPVIKRSDFRRYIRDGNRTRHQAAESARSRELELAALALWLDHPKADLDYLQDILWSYCDDWTWVMAAHKGHCVNDLGSTMRAARLAEILFALEEQIEPEVADRVHGEIERRLFRNVANYDNTEFWHTARMNWNHVCNGSIVRAALLEIKDPRALARMLHPVIQHMTYALDGFTDDGGCVEGPGYWAFGFGHFVQAAYALHNRTGGELNIMADEKVERICRFPLAAHIDGDLRASFADCKPGMVPMLNALQINHFYRIPELYELCSRRAQKTAKGSTVIDSRFLHKYTPGKLAGPGPLAVGDMHSLALYRGEKATGRSDSRDYYLPDLGMIKMRGKSGMVVVALAGNNGVPHNHNDIGTFMVYLRGRMLLTDPGAPLYNYETFREKRYEILWCRSRPLGADHQWAGAGVRHPVPWRNVGRRVQPVRHQDGDHRHESRLSAGDGRQPGSDAVAGWKRPHYRRRVPLQEEASLPRGGLRDLREGGDEPRRQCHPHRLRPGLREAHRRSTRPLSRGSGDRRA